MIKEMVEIGFVMIYAFKYLNNESFEIKPNPKNLYPQIYYPDDVKYFEREHFDLVVKHLKMKMKMKMKRKRRKEDGNCCGSGSGNNNNNANNNNNNTNDNNSCININNNNNNCININNNNNNNNSNNINTPFHHENTYIQERERTRPPLLSLFLHYLFFHHTTHFSCHPTMPEICVVGGYYDEGYGMYGIVLCEIDIGLKKS
jgi:hypothetical protein